MRPCMPSNNCLITGTGDRPDDGTRHIDKGQKRKPLGWYLLLGWILFLYIFACYYGMNYINHSRSDKVDLTIPQDFRSRLKKHGLDKKLSIVEISNGKLYFYRDDKKCKF